MGTCWNCGWEWQESREPSFNETCPECFSYLHCCKNCKHYDPAVANDCESHTAEWVQDKEKLNFCEEFRMAERKEEDVRPIQGKATEEGKEAFKRIFGDPDQEKEDPSDRLGRFLRGDE